MRAEAADAQIRYAPKAQMITLREVRQAIDEAQIAFEKSLETLADIKCRGAHESDRGRLLAFQYELAGALFSLDDVYRTVVSTQNSLVSRKSEFAKAWFAAAMRRLAHFAEAIVRTLRIGKVLGDSFAWLFYQRDTHLLEKHLAHPGQLHMPPGVGGRGELEITKNVRIIPDHIVLYHGITSFLRLGDVSLVHLPTLSISAVAELKTRVLDDGRMQTTLHVIGDKTVLPRRLARFAASVPEAAPTARMSAKKEDQLKRQIQRIAGLVELTEPDRRLRIRQSSNIEKLNDLVHEAGTRRLSHAKLDDGLAIIGIRFRGRARLSTLLLPAREAKIDEALEPARTIAMELLDPSSRANSLIMNDLNLGYDGGMTPLFWSPIVPDVFRSLLFLEVAVWSWFNPLHLVKKLRQRSFEVETNHMGVPTRIIAPAKEGKTVVDNVDTFMTLVHQHLYSERGFVEAIERILQAAHNSKVPTNTRIVMQLNQFYGHPPPPRRRRRARRLRGA